MTDTVTTKIDSGVMTITMCDEENRNTLRTELLEPLLDAMDDADADEAVRVVVLTNTGRVFCAGADLKEGGRGVSAGGGRRRTGRDVFARFAASPKPFVARIAGHCVAGGMGLAAGADIAVAVDDAKMGFTEVRLGLSPAMISVLCLPKMRAADASAAFLRGNRFTAVEAAEMGIINAAVSADRLDAEVDAVVADLLLGGPGGIAACKQLLSRVPTMTVDEAFAWTAELSAGLFRSDEAREGMAAYVEKRPPSWAPPSD